MTATAEPHATVDAPPVGALDRADGVELLGDVHGSGFALRRDEEAHRADEAAQFVARVGHRGRHWTTRLPQHRSPSALRAARLRGTLAGPFGPASGLGAPSRI